MSKHLMPYHDNFFDDFFGNDLRFPGIFGDRSGRIIGFPRIDVSDKGESIIVTANVPGVASKDIHIEVEDNLLTISGHVVKEEEEGKKDSEFYRLEREEGAFSRTVSLPSPVQNDRVEAKTKNGVLTITLPKKTETERPKISIKEE